MYFDWNSAWCAFFHTSVNQWTRESLQIIYKVYRPNPQQEESHCQKGLDLDLALKYLRLDLDFTSKTCEYLCYKLGTSVFGEFLPFFTADPLKLCQVGWGVSMHSYFGVSPEMSEPAQVWALDGPLKDIQRLIPKPLLHCLGCVLRDVVLLKGVCSPQFEVLSALEQVFIKDLSVLCSVHLSLDPD